MGRNLDKLIDVLKSDERIIAGIMSGTSADGVDIAIVEIKGHGRGIRYRIIYSYVYKYPKELHDWITNLTESNCCIDKVCLGNFLIGDVFSKALKEALDTANIDPRDIDAVSSHGQTIYHIPEYIEIGDSLYRCTLQLGSPQVIAEKTGILTIGDFRVRDIAAGGQGAPIIAYVDYTLLSSSNVNRAVQNIGGIANVTVIPRSPTLDDVYAFDTGPGNMVINEVVKILTNSSLDYDINGELASKGSVDQNLLEELLNNRFIQSKPPKTTGREEFGRRYAEALIKKGISRGLNPEDIVATATMFVVKSIIYNYDRYILPYIQIDEVIIGGGGVKNKTLMNWLREEFRSRGIKVYTHEDLGIDSKIKEALGIAILGHESLSLIPNNIPKATGASKKVVLGTIAPA